MNNLYKKKLISAKKLIKLLPINKKIKKNIKKTKKKIQDILHNKKKKFLIITGPCSIHKINEAITYAKKLIKEKKKFKKELIIIMRTYFEKPRTNIGWKGLINDPYLNNTFKINEGLYLARKLLIDINNMGLTTATEFLNINTIQYFSDLITWGAIGARTTESQIHRELASNLDCPIGFKNSTNGNIKTAINAIKTSLQPHHFISPKKSGKLTIFLTKGNKNCHIILRGGENNYTNFDKKNIFNTYKKLKKNNLLSKIMIDVSHDNSNKKQINQIIVCKNIIKQISKGENKIFGIMIESNLISGKQILNIKKKLIYGQSITDECIDFKTTKKILKKFSKIIKKKY